jgi:phospholipid-binding lipoprotein MlaA
MLGTHLIAASLSAAAPVVQPPMAQAWQNLPAREVAAGDREAPDAVAPLPSAPPADDSVQPATPDEAAPPPPPPATPEALPADDLDIDLSHTGLENDPLEGFNRVSFEFSQAVDKLLIRPAAMVYRTVIPKPLRDGAHNALENIGEPLVFLNDFLQLRPKRMLHTFLRFLVNSTLGIGGLFDVAKSKPFGLPHHDNSFGDTLGYYGVKAGPYIYLPILGPTTLRDALGSSENLIEPMLIGSPFDRSDYQISTTVVSGLDQRERNDDELKAMLRGAIDPYATFRADYLQNRAGEIASLKAKPGEEPAVGAFDDPLTDPLADPAAAPPPGERKQPAH